MIYPLQYKYEIRHFALNRCKHQHQIATTPPYNSQGLLREAIALLCDDSTGQMEVLPQTLLPHLSSPIMLGPCASKRHQHPPRSGRVSPQVNFFEVHFLEKIHKKNINSRAGHTAVLCPTPVPRAARTDEHQIATAPPYKSQGLLLDTR
jgi:hypothetical protein